ncbi:MAG TPA: VOC family protein [Trebonia sp.]|jgi:hypothetical protein|nr:VOC family protein [Trebonia sp.]
MSTRLRHVVLVGQHLDAEAKVLSEVLGIEEAFREPPGLGLDMENIVMPIGSSFIEICVGTKPGAPARRYMQTAGPGGYMVLLQFPDFEAARAQAQAHGARLVWEFDSGGHRECHLHPRDVGGAIVGIEWSRDWTEWRWAGTSWRSHVRPDSVTGLAGVTISTADPAALSQRWADLFGLQLDRQGDGSIEAKLGDQSIRFSYWPRPDSRLTGIDLRAVDAHGVRRRAAAAGCPVHDGDVLLAGVRFRLLEAG